APALVPALTSCCRSFSFHSHTCPRALPSFPTRRSSDLGQSPHGSPTAALRGPESLRKLPAACNADNRGAPRRTTLAGPTRRPSRSEEHTSELQSRFDLVCRLLLEKKNAPAHLQRRSYCS